MVKVGLLPPLFFMPFTNFNFFNFQNFFWSMIANGGATIRVRLPDLLVCDLVVQVRRSQLKRKQGIMARSRNFAQSEPG